MDFHQYDEGCNVMDVQHLALADTQGKVLYSAGMHPNVS